MPRIIEKRPVHDRQFGNLPVVIRIALDILDRLAHADLLSPPLGKTTRPCVRIPSIRERGCIRRASFGTHPPTAGHVLTD